MIFLYLFLITKTLRRRLELEIEETVKNYCKTLFSFPRFITNYFSDFYETLLYTFGLTKTLFTISTLWQNDYLTYSAFSQTN